MEGELLTHEDIAEYAPDGWTATVGKGGVRFDPAGKDTSVYVEVANGFTDPVLVAARVDEDDGPDRLIDLPRNPLPQRNEEFAEAIKQKVAVAEQEIERNA